MRRQFILAAVIATALMSSPAWARQGADPGAKHARGWIGGGTGLVFGHVDLPCGPPVIDGEDCGKDGGFQTYTANLTLSGASGATLRLRGLRAEDSGSRHHPWEEAALVGTRFGRSNWYGLVGAGRVVHPHDRFPSSDAHGFAWEILFAPATEGPIGLELSFQGDNGRDVDFFAFNVGMRIGALR